MALLLREGGVQKMLLQMNNNGGRGEHSKIVDFDQKYFLNVPKQQNQVIISIYICTHLR